ncbi:hypothetical protein [Brevibacterium luteolum]|uniref:hypothetical protein n=1 Tax=Brevibacterium luteolum TaxID=199591 RepID=UPI00223AB94C|nr:hypothetical protein [Brevibacterium luteolum]MCT1873578.1 hypothetical protein [Brevibacterium luteolum]MCT1889827.1 hypothetical protein [Brevibacterium luteolum]MCT1892432.1 hypothetical protein [Brevibacterium luteolum]MCT1923275.1 hypothetical protein [Brevibacterium luteolum]
MNDDTIDVSVRRSPKYSAFIILGVILGMIAGGILSFLPVDMAGVEVDVTQASATWMLMVFVGTIGGFLGAVVALILDRISLRRARTYTVPAVHDPAPGAVDTEAVDTEVPEVETAGEQPSEPGRAGETDVRE